MIEIALTCLLGFLGGCFAASIGGTLAFGVVAVLAPVCWVIVARTGSSWALDAVAFGPLFGPHVGFAGAGAATIYAAHRGLIASGKLVTVPLARLRDVRVIAVGGAFGAFGVLVADLVTRLPWFGQHTDPVACTVIVSAFAARLLFGDRTLLHRTRFNKARGWRRIAPTDEHCWLPHQQQPRHYIALGTLVGAVSGLSCLVLGHLAPGAAASSNVVAFGVTGWAIIALTFDARVFVTHHIANIGGLATILTLPLLNGPPAWESLGTSAALTGAMVSLLAAAVAGTMGAAAAELGARLFLNRSDSFIDPPALAIAPCATLLRGVFGP